MANEEKITCFKGSRGSQFSPVESESGGSRAPRGRSL